MQKFTVQKLATAGVVGAAYAALALFGSIFGVTYGPIQCRFSEALCVLPFLFPETAWGLGIGCLIANVFSPYGLLDIVVGSCATFLAALLTARCKKKWLAPLPPVVLNMLLVGAMLAYEERARARRSVRCSCSTPRPSASGRPSPATGWACCFCTRWKRAGFFRIAAG